MLHARHLVPEGQDTCVLRLDVELLAPPSVSFITESLTVSEHKAVQRLSRRYCAELTNHGSLGCQIWPHWPVSRE